MTRGDIYEHSYRKMEDVRNDESNRNGNHPKGKELLQR
jgi:hypothetical protein